MKSPLSLRSPGGKPALGELDTNLMSMQICSKAKKMETRLSITAKARRRLSGSLQPLSPSIGSPLLNVAEERRAAKLILQVPDADKIHRVSFAGPPEDNAHGMAASEDQFLTTNKEISSVVPVPRNGEISLDSTRQEGRLRDGMGKEEWMSMEDGTDFFDLVKKRHNLVNLASATHDTAVRIKDDTKHIRVDTQLIRVDTKELRGEMKQVKELLTIALADKIAEKPMRIKATGELIESKKVIKAQRAIIEKDAKAEERKKLSAEQRSRAPASKPRERRGELGHIDRFSEKAKVAAAAKRKPFF